MSPNAQVVHGIPNNIPLQEGDIISIDCGALKNGFYGDHAYTFEVGEVDAASKNFSKLPKNHYMLVYVNSRLVIGLAMLDLPFNSTVKTMDMVW